jgi:hypothetical protein
MAAALCPAGRQIRAAKICGILLLGSSLALPLLSLAATERLDSGYVIDVEGQSFKFAHFDPSSECRDSNDLNYSLNPFMQSYWPIFTSSPCGTNTFMGDVRPEASESVIDCLLKVANTSPTTQTPATHYLGFEFITNDDFPLGPDTNRLHLAKAELTSPMLSGGATNICFNIDERIANSDGIVQLPSFQAIPAFSTNEVGRLRLSVKFKNQPLTLGNHSSSTTDLTINQLSGLTYALGDIDAANGFIAIVNATNLLYVPTNTFVKTNNVPVRLSWVNASSNYLGTMIYQFAVTNEPPPNTPPLALALSIAGRKGTNAVPFSFPVSDLDTNDVLSGFIVTEATNGTVTVVGTNGTYIACSNAPLADSFVYGVSDGNGGFATNTASVTLTNTAPVAFWDSLTNQEGQLSIISLHGSDEDGDPLLFQVTNLPPNGSLSGNGSNRTYTAGNNFYGNDSFGFTASDGYATSAVATVTVTVLPLNREPVILHTTASGTNLQVSAQVQPNRTTMPQECRLLNAGWSDLTGLAQSTPISTNLLVPAMFTIPAGTNTQGFIRLKSSTN